MGRTGLNLSNTFRIFVKDLLNPEFDMNDIRVRWDKADGLYQAIAENKTSLNMFGIKIIEDIPEKIVIKRLRKNTPEIFHIYSEDNVVGAGI